MNTKSAVYLLAGALIVLSIITAERIIRLTHELNALQESFLVVTNRPVATPRPVTK